MTWYQTTVHVMHGTDIGVMPRDSPDKISIGHGSGGSMSRKLIEELFAREFNAGQDAVLGDSAVLNLEEDNLAFTTDSYVVDPLFFPPWVILEKWQFAEQSTTWLLPVQFHNTCAMLYILSSGRNYRCALAKIAVSLARAAEGHWARSIS